MSDEFVFGILAGALITFLADSLLFTIYKKEIYERLHKELTNKYDAEIANLKALKSEPVFDKIRSEIEQLPTTKCTETYRRYIVADDFKENVLAIFDKYKAESEE